MNKETSDEKLLKLIEGSSSVKPVQKLGVKPKGKGLLPFPLKFNFKVFLNPQNINKGLFVTCAILTFVLLLAIISGANVIKADLLFPSSKSGAGLAKLSIKDGNKFLALQDYLSEIGKRNIFLSPGAKASAEKELNPDLSQLVQDLKLVGVIWSKNPEVMIESSKENRTYLLKKGDTFSQPQLKIKDITRNSAILEMEVEGQTKEYELR